MASTEALTQLQARLSPSGHNLASDTSFLDHLLESAWSYVEARCCRPIRKSSYDDFFMLQHQMRLLLRVRPVITITKFVLKREAEPRPITSTDTSLYSILPDETGEFIFDLERGIILLKRPQLGSLLVSYQAGLDWADLDNRQLELMVTVAEYFFYLRASAGRTSEASSMSIGPLRINLSSDKQSLLLLRREMDERIGEVFA